MNAPLARHLSQGPVVWWRDADTVAIAGHRTTYTRPFRRLNELRRGDVIRVGHRVYRVRRLTRVRPWETWVLHFRGLVLSACDPPGSDAYRLVVFAALDAQ